MPTPGARRRSAPPSDGSAAAVVRRHVGGTWWDLAVPDSPSSPVLRAPAGVGWSGARGTAATAPGRSSTSAAGPVLARPTLADVPQDGPGRPVALDDAQRAAVEAVAGGERALLVLGAPGTGKTTVALEAVVEAARRGARPDDVLVLAASRRLAGDLRDRLAARWPHTAGRPLVQTPAAAAFAVLRARAVALGEPPPALVSGAEQDLVLAEPPRRPRRGGRGPGRLAGRRPRRGARAAGVPRRACATC